ncbi:MAG: phosphomannomutase/phosphoglucomutase [Magnetococcus sp. DMHC-6]
MINPQIFREYDIRGVAGKDLTEGVVTLLGGHFAQRVLLESVTTSQAPPLVVIARDGRLSSPSLASALAQGLVGRGVDVVDIGLAPTPALYFAAHHFQAAAGVMLTGSHNPPDHNGLKMVLNGRPFFGADIQDLGERVRMGFASAANVTGQMRQESILETYVARVVRDFKPGRPIRVVMDCGNGATGVVANEILHRLANVCGEVLFAEVDGRFPNHHPDPTVPKNLLHLQKRMQETEAQLGIAFDGDGDRIGALDENGEILWGDRMMILFARDLLKEHPGATVIGDVKCSQLLFDAIAKAGGVPLMWKTGHSLVKDKMRQTGALLGGEMSGHLFFADRYYGYDDALYAAVRLIELLAAQDSPLGVRLADLPKVFATPELRIFCADDVKFQVMERISLSQKAQGADLSDVDGIRVRDGDGWWLLRVSNTQPALVVRIEAQSAEGLRLMAQRVAGILAQEGVAFPDL